MNKNEKEYLISRYNDPDLSASERVKLSAILGQSDSRRMQEQYRRLDAALSEIPSCTEGVDYQAFSNRVREGIAERTWRAADRRATVFRWVAPLAAAAVFMMAAIPLWYMQHHPDSPDLAIRHGVAMVVNPEIPVGRVVSQVKVMDLTPAGQGVNSTAIAAVVPQAAGSPEEEGTVMCFVSPEGDSQTGSNQFDNDSYLSVL